jgi:hypothetical protein
MKNTPSKELGFSDEEAQRRFEAALRGSRK